jgi:hypothetical protein
MSINSEDNKHATVSLRFSWGGGASLLVASKFVLLRSANFLLAG